MPLGTARRPLGRIAVVLLALLATVAALLAYRPAPAAAQTDCTGPFTVTASGPGLFVWQTSGDSMFPTFSGVGVPLQLAVVGAAGNPVGDCADGTTHLLVTWSGPRLTGTNPVSATELPRTQAGTWDDTYAVDVRRVALSCTSAADPGCAGDVLLSQQVTNTWMDGGPVTYTLTPAGGPVLQNVPAAFMLELRDSKKPRTVAVDWQDGTSTTLTVPATIPFDAANGSYDFTANLTHTYPWGGSANPELHVADILASDHQEYLHSFHVFAAPLPSFTAPDTVAAGSALAVDGTSSTVDPATPIDFSWNFGDGEYSLDTGSRPTANWLYQHPGTYPVTLTVTDSYGRKASTTHDVTYEEPPPPGQPPTASWTSSPSSPVAGSPVAFDGSASSDSDGWVVSYSWLFGDDGSTSTAVAPTHAFGHAGAYPVTLTVTDNTGQTGSSTRTIQVVGSPPVAAFTVPDNPTAGALTTFDGSGSSDPDGAVAAWSWDFGDGAQGTTATPQHRYAHAGSYDVTLTVTDGDGHTASTSHSVTVHGAAPLAAMVLPGGAVAGSPATFDGSPSSDSDGQVVSYAWTFGDGTTSAQPSPNHTYGHAGSYPVGLTVTDDDGLTGTTAGTVTVAGAAPAAAFVAPTASAGAPVVFDGTASSDPDGSVVAWHWNFGDGTAADGATSAHAFPSAGTYPVTLTVTDDSGLANTVTHPVTVGQGLPTAAFTGPASATTGAVLTFDGSPSTDPGGALTTWSWTFGDGASASGSRVTHAYRTPGTYQVALTVADASGLIATDTHPVTVSWPPTDLSVTTTGSTPRSGQYTYTVTVKNLGRSAARAVQLAVALDPAQVLALKPVAPTALACSGVGIGATGTVSCRAATATLAAGKSWVVKVTVRQPSAGTVRSVTETSTVSAANPDPVPGNNTNRLTTTLR